MFAKVPKIPENRENMEKLLELLQFPLQLEGVTVKVVVDIKLMVVLMGIHGTGARYNCPWCEVRYLFIFFILLN